MISALHVGNTILKRGQAEDIEITPMKLQKLLYIVYKEYYKRTNEALFAERFEAWKYGPVITSVYDTFYAYGENAIQEMGVSPDGSVCVVKQNNANVFTYVLDDMWNKYKRYSGIQLSAMTQQHGGAWAKAVATGTQLLKDEDIKEERNFV